MWVVRRLKAVGASEQEMLKVLRCQVLSVLHFAVPAWTTMLGQGEINRIESVQKTGLYLVYGPRYRSCVWPLQQAKNYNFTTLKMFDKFTRACLRSPKFSKWFMKSEDSRGVSTRSTTHMFKPVPARTSAYAKSAIPQMVALANRLQTPGIQKVRLNSGKLIIV